MHSDSFSLALDSTPFMLLPVILQYHCFSEVGEISVHKLEALIGRGMNLARLAALQGNLDVRLTSLIVLDIASWSFLRCSQLVLARPASLCHHLTRQLDVPILSSIFCAIPNPRIAPQECTGPGKPACSHQPPRMLEECSLLGSCLALGSNFLDVNLEGATL
jgi:hypothetical protein